MWELSTLEMLSELIANPNNKYECSFGVVEMSNGDIIWYHSRLPFNLSHGTLNANWVQIHSLLDYKND